MHEKCCVGWSVFLTNEEVVLWVSQPLCNLTTKWQGLYEMCLLEQLTLFGFVSVINTKTKKRSCYWVHGIPFEVFLPQALACAQRNWFIVLFFLLLFNCCVWPHTVWLVKKLHLKKRDLWLLMIKMEVLPSCKCLPRWRHDFVICAFQTWCLPDQAWLSTCL